MICILVYIHDTLYTVDLLRRLKRDHGAMVFTVFFLIALSSYDQRW